MHAERRVSRERFRFTASDDSGHRVRRESESCTSRRQFVIYLVKQIKKMVVIQIKKKKKKKRERGGQRKGEKQRERERERREAPSGFTSTHLHTKKDLVV